MGNSPKMKPVPLAPKDAERVRNEDQDLDQDMGPMTDKDRFKDINRLRVRLANPVVTPKDVPCLP